MYLVKALVLFSLLVWKQGVAEEGKTRNSALFVPAGLTASTTSFGHLVVDLKIQHLSESFEWIHDIIQLVSKLQTPVKVDSLNLEYGLDR